MLYNYYNPYTNYGPYYQRPQYQPVSSLQGKTVDNIEVVKAVDIPLDGSISYFPLADNSAIASKQLQQDGTSKIIVYKPVTGEVEQTKYVTENELSNLQKEIEELKAQIETIKRGE